MRSPTSERQVQRIKADIESTYEIDLPEWFVKHTTVTEIRSIRYVLGSVKAYADRVEREENSAVNEQLFGGML